jgi:hypothetical protein
VVINVRVLKESEKKKNVDITLFKVLVNEKWKGNIPVHESTGTGVSAFRYRYRSVSI